ncbi:MAG: ATP phosphoribosyltransferase regulatory subunit [Actinobacteria bacterium]|nr:ATP phosphoribosyltransferase regulatory subunit [Actinomycetota bacterium]
MAKGDIVRGGNNIGGSNYNSNYGSNDSNLIDKCTANYNKASYAGSEDIIAKLPFGFRDIFPTEASERTRIEEVIREEFRLWGYGEVKTPIVEYTRNISEGVGKNWENKLINFFDVDGKLVSLRADMTIPIARLTGMRIRKSQLPVRFCYFANCFRQSELQKGIKRVYNQAGLELIGSCGFMSDTEVILILINLLKKLEISDYKIGLGHIDVVEGLFSWIGLDSMEREYLKKRLILKDFVSIEEFLKTKDGKKSATFLELIKPRPGLKDTENLVSEVDDTRAQSGFSYVKKVYETLKELGFCDFIIIDFGILRDFEYYTGLLFEVYSLGVIDILGSGGRYDGLIKKFGLDTPATGFALDIDLLHKSISNCKLSTFKNERKLLVFSESENYPEVVRISENIRKEGVCVELVFSHDIGLQKFREVEDVVTDVSKVALRKNYKFAAIIKSNLKDVVFVDVVNKKIETRKLELFVKEIKEHIG